MDAQKVVRRLNESLSNDDLWTNPSIVDDVEELADGYDALKAENAKLREISADMLKCIKKTKVSKAFCWKCPHHRDIDELRSACFLADDARKLGIEVE